MAAIVIKSSWLSCSSASRTRIISVIRSGPGRVRRSDHACEVLSELLSRPRGGDQRLFVVGADGRGERGRPGAQLIEVALRQPEKPAGNEQRERNSDILDQFALSAGNGVVHEAPGRPLDQWFDPLDGGSGERAPQERPESAVRGRIGQEYALGHHLDHRVLSNRPDPRLGEVFLAESRVGGDQLYVPMPTGEPESVGTPMHGILAPEPLVVRIRVAEDIDVADVERPAAAERSLFTLHAPSLSCVPVTGA
ncbi:hypothetical protein [Streptomyces sp. NPDC000410]|uniref:hypothetical protein n=1 Tax=Streptomyces sp. NPDC000410 TaxID=3154254 RepID=UPI0033225722